MSKKSSKGYTFGNLLFDIFMTCITGTIWLWYRLFRILTTK